MVRHHPWEDKEGDWEELDDGSEERAQLCITNCSSAEDTLDNGLVGAPILMMMMMMMGSFMMHTSAVMLLVSECAATTSDRASGLLSRWRKRKGAMNEEGEATTTTAAAAAAAAAAKHAQRKRRDVPVATDKGAAHPHTQHWITENKGVKRIILVCL